ncbi:SDR family NAD(P)-dependent oxidoreductase [Actinoplanes sp. NPDC051470]|uniref:SDR family NAD(P)-dependent oxidoreductase n=1 Tax=unclassified Actinoplanes TaxID=2626549 RepID=UPI003414F730
MSKTWFITGASRGLGRQWTEAALERGDSVAAAVRDLASVEMLRSRYPETLLPVRLDVTDRDEAYAAVTTAAERFGKLDVVINAAGYGHFGVIEELTEAEVRAQMEANFYGMLWVTQAVLPLMRAAGSGHIIQVSSYGGVTTFPVVGAYAASKWAVEGLNQTLAQEVGDFGIRVTLVEPGPYATDWAGSSARASVADPAYADVKKRNAEYWAAASFGDPAATRGAILRLADAPHPPLRMFLGRAPLDIVSRDYEDRLATWRKWQPVAEEAH